MHCGWPEFRGHKPFGNGSDSLVEDIWHWCGVRANSNPVSIIYWRPLQGRALCSKLRLCWAQDRGVSFFMGLAWQVRDKQFARWFRREGSRWPTSAVPRSLAPEAPSFGASVAMRVWGGECFCSNSLICLVLSESVSPLALLMCVSGYLPGSFLMSHKVSRYC